MAPTAKGQPKRRPVKKRKVSAPKTTKKSRTVLRLGRPLSSTEEVRVVQAGVPVTLVRQIQKEADLTQETLSKILGIPKRTFINHLKKSHLDEDESDRVIRLKRVLELATDTFEGDKESALAWLRSPNRALGGRIPIELVSTGTGARAVEQVLGRMEHSLYS